jgi:hypothetical protein
MLQACGEEGEVGEQFGILVLSQTPPRYRLFFLTAYMVASAAFRRLSAVVLSSG